MSRKTFVRYFTIADFEEEEIWLREQHRHGLRLIRMVLPCFYIFEECPPEDVVYRLDFKNNRETGDYLQLLRDYGWEFIDRCGGWLFFRKPSAAGPEEDCEIFSDNGSKANMIDRVIKTRLVLVTAVYICLILSCYVLSTAVDAPLFAAAFYAVATPLYLYLIIYCGVKLRRLRKKYTDQ